MTDPEALAFLRSFCPDEPALNGIPATDLCSEDAAVRAIMALTRRSDAPLPEAMVLQCDRDAAADWFFVPDEPGSAEFSAMLRDGRDDSNSLVQLLAAHRQNAGVSEMRTIQAIKLVALSFAAEQRPLARIIRLCLDAGILENVDALTDDPVVHALAHRRRPPRLLP